MEENGKSVIKNLIQWSKDRFVLLLWKLSQKNDSISLSLQQDDNTSNIPNHPYPFAEELKNRCPFNDSGRPITGYGFADPFYYCENGIHYIFCEKMGREKNFYGKICYFASLDGKEWYGPKLILDTGYHLAFPHIFKWEKNHYLIPHTQPHNGNKYDVIELFKATDFPNTWEHVNTIISRKNGNGQIHDPVTFRWENKWWIIANAGKEGLYVWYSKDLEEPSGWNEHKNNPVISHESKFSYDRPGGRVITGKNEIYIPLMQESIRDKIGLFMISELSENTFKIKDFMVPILDSENLTWAKDGAHTFSLWQNNYQVSGLGDWIAAVDGRDKIGYRIGLFKST